jgi:hypothetical protein
MVPRNNGTDGNKIADHLTRLGPSLPFTEPDTATGISIKVVRRVTGSRISRDNKRQLQSIHQQRQAKGIF